VNAGLASLFASREAVAKFPRTPRSAGRSPRFRLIPRLPNAVDVEPAPPPVLEQGSWLPTHDFRAHTATLADNVGVKFGGCGDRVFQGHVVFQYLYVGRLLIFHGAESAHSMFFLFHYHRDDADRETNHRRVARTLRLS
jgi:hypothetical protein